MVDGEVDAGKMRGTDKSTEKETGGRLITNA